jgi:hypothetical protein
MKQRFNLLVSVLIFLIPVGSAKSQNAQNVKKLFEAGPTAFGDQEISAIKAGISVNRSRLVKIVLPLIDRKAADEVLAKAPKAFGEGPLESLPSLKRVELNLFDDVSLVTDLRRVSVSADGKTVVWVGTIDGMKNSQVSLATTDGIVSGNVATSVGKIYQIRPSEAAKGNSYILERDQASFPKEKEPVHVAPGPPRAADAAPGSDDGSTIDVLIGYTTSAKTAAGGENGIKNLIQIGLNETNQGYANSGVVQRIRIVHTVEVNYDESSGFDAALDRLTKSSDGSLNKILSLRNQYGADLVSLWINNSQYCGLANLMTQPDPSFESKAFSVVNVSCATGYYSFAHEMGHNQGCQHDRNNSDGPGAFPYSYGYQQTVANPIFRTIMAYECSGTPCKRINYWANPDVKYEGIPTGTVPHSQQAADDSLSLNNTRLLVSRFRNAVAIAVTAQ